MKNFILIILINFALSNESGFNSEEGNLTNNFFISYQKLIRPSESVKISIHLALKKITSLDEKNQILTTSSYLFAKWSDKRLAWNESIYNRTHVPIYASKIWLPDLYVINSAQQDAFLTMTDYDIVWVDSSGEVFATYDLLGLQTQCEIDSPKFPFDEQNCSIRIGSWQYNIEKIVLSIGKNSSEQNIDYIDYIENPLWKLIDLDFKLAPSDTRINPHLNWKQKEIDFIMTFKRRSSYYMVNNIYPCLLLNILTLLLFPLPFALQATLSMTIFLTLAVYSVRISGDLPAQSKNFPWISVYFFLSLLYTLLAFVWFVVLNHFKSTNHLVIWLRKKPQGKISSSNQFERIENLANQIRESNQNCIKCSLCDKCLQSKKKEEYVKKEKDKLEAFGLNLNKIAFLILFSLTFLSNLIIWLIVSN